MGGGGNGNHQKYGPGNRDERCTLGTEPAEDGRTLAHQKKKRFGKKDLDEFDLAKLKLEGWAHKRIMHGLQAF